MQEKLVYQYEAGRNKIDITTDRVVVNLQVIPANPSECRAIGNSTGFIRQKTEFFIAFSSGDLVHRNKLGIFHALNGKRYLRDEILAELGVSLRLVTTELEPKEAKQLEGEVNEALKKATAWKQISAADEVASGLAGLDKI